MIRCAVLLVFAVATAAADGPAVNGFVTGGRGQLQGTVTDDEGAPLANVIVHVVSSAGGEQLVRTDRQGAYRATLRGGERTHVFIARPGRILGTTTGTDAAEAVVEIHDILRPASAARPRKRAGAIPPYSDAAIDADVWTRAWLMLHVSDKGVVTHVKLVRSPGYDLDEGAIRAAFALRFEPARDRADRPTRSLVLWTYEWPPYWWLRRGSHPVSRVPAAAVRVPCRRADRPRRWDRDCTTADLATSAARPWLAKRPPGT